MTDVLQIRDAIGIVAFLQCRITYQNYVFPGLFICCIKRLMSRYCSIIALFWSLTIGITLLIFHKDGEKLLLKAVLKIKNNDLDKDGEGVSLLKKTSGKYNVDRSKATQMIGNQANQIQKTNTE